MNENQKSQNILDTYSLWSLVLFLTMFFSIFVTQALILIKIAPILSGDIDLNALTIVVFGSNLALFQILWFTLKVTQPRQCVQDSQPVAQGSGEEKQCGDKSKQIVKIKIKQYIGEK